MSAELAGLIKERARELGFSAVGITGVEPLTPAAERLQIWLDSQFHGTMDWMSRRRKERPDPTAFFPEAKSVVCLAFNYFRNEAPRSAEDGNISLYARGRDYHKVLRKKLKKLLIDIQTRVPEASGRICVDSFPLMEKPLAAKAGIGWIGKHTNLILKKGGSYFFLAELLLSIDLPQDAPFTADHCGTCRRCQDACPTNALETPYVLDASRCISYLTIEHSGEIDPSLTDKMENWVFGCDVCQAVCPWTRFSEATSEADFVDRLPESQRKLTALEMLPEADFDQRFAGTPVKRAGFQNFKRNVRIARQNRND